MSADDIPGWFPYRNRARLAQLISQLGVKSVIEIGCFLGLSTVWFALHTFRVQCIDTWREDAQEPSGNNLVETLARMGCPRDFYHVWEGNVARSGMWPKVTPIRGRSQEIHGHVVSADLVYIDGDHGYEECKRDIELYAPKAKMVVCGDDYIERPEFGVIEAVTELLPGHQSDGQFWWAVK
jgi:hypothetical protein